MYKDINVHRYQLQRAGDANHKQQKYTCPNCEQIRFVRYVDTWHNSIYIADNVGRCERVDNCGLHYTPSEYFKQYPDQRTDRTPPPPKPTENPKPTDYIPQDLFNSLPADKHYFLIYLKNLFGATVANHLMKRYKVTSLSKIMQHVTAFWQIDINGNIRTGKTILYDKETGKREKDHITGYTHRYFKDKLGTEFNLKQCLFGEHLINKYSKNNTVCIVESEKTAIIASVFLPKLIWLATSGATQKPKEKIQAILKYCNKILLIPDLSTGDHWSIKWGEIAKELDNTGRQVVIWDLLEKIATPEQKANGLDLADVYTKTTEAEIKQAVNNYMDYFGLYEPVQTIQPPKEPLFFDTNKQTINNNNNDNNKFNDSKLNTYSGINGNDSIVNPYKTEIEALQAYFDKQPSNITEPIKINHWSTIIGGNWQKSVSNYIDTLKTAKQKNNVFDNCINKLNDIKMALAKYIYQKKNKCLAIDKDLKIMYVCIII